MKNIQKKEGRKPRQTFGERLIRAMGEVVAIERGDKKPAAVRRYAVTAREVEAEPAPELDAADVRKIRRDLEISQPVFAAALNVSPETVKAWEQGKAPPGGAAARLLQIVQLRPDIIRATILPRKQVATVREAQMSHAAYVAGRSRLYPKVPTAAAKAGRPARRGGRVAKR
ncbi:MAG: helix-turn-helix domain-containing protein [Gemmatimonadaceae bacterium]